MRHIHPSHKLQAHQTIEQRKEYHKIKVIKKLLILTLIAALLVFATSTTVANSKISCETIFVSNGNPAPAPYPDDNKVINHPTSTDTAKAA